MERAEWLLLMNIKCKLLAMEGDFYKGNIASAVSGGFVPKLLHFIPKGKAGRSASRQYSVKLVHVSLFIPTSPYLGRASIAPARSLRSSLALPDCARIVPGGGTRSALHATGF